MRILFLTQWFQPEVHVKGLPFALELKKLGHEVVVITGFPNYPTGKIFPPYTIKPRLIENVEGVRVIRVPLYPSHDRSALRRSLNYLSFTAAASTIGLLSVQKPDVIYAYLPPATAVFPAWIYRLITGVPYVLDVQDLWPDTLLATGMFSSRTGFKIMNSFCNEMYRAAAHVVALSPGFEETFVKRGVPPSKVTVIPNWADDAVMKPTTRNEELAKTLSLTGRFNVMFAGNMGLAQGLDTILQSASELQSRCPHAQYVLVGSGVDLARIKQDATDRKLNNVKFIDRQPLTKMPELFALADVMLVHLKDLPLWRIAIPSRIQAYMATGRPILCAVAGDAAELVERANAGITCPPENPHALTDSVCKFEQCTSASLEAFGKNGLKYYQSELSMSVGATRFADLFTTIVGNRHA